MAKKRRKRRTPPAIAIGGADRRRLVLGEAAELEANTHELGGGDSFPRHTTTPPRTVKQSTAARVPQPQNKRGQEMIGLEVDAKADAVVLRHVGRFHTDNEDLKDATFLGRQFAGDEPRAGDRERDHGVDLSARRMIAEYRVSLVEIVGLSGDVEGLPPVDDLQRRQGDLARRVGLGPVLGRKQTGGIRRH